MEEKEINNETSTEFSGFLMFALLFKKKCFSKFVSFLTSKSGGQTKISENFKVFYGNMSNMD